MTHPLEYRNASGPQRDDADRTPRAPRAVIPLEFDTVITTTKDPGGAGAVEHQLRRERIPVYRTHDGPVVDQTIELIVRAQDKDRASQIASDVFARRQKLKSFPR